MSATLADCEPIIVEQPWVEGYRLPPHIVEQPDVGGLGAFSPELFANGDPTLVHWNGSEVRLFVDDSAFRYRVENFTDYCYIARRVA